MNEWVWRLGQFSPYLKQIKISLNIEAFIFRKMNYCIWKQKQGDKFEIMYDNKTWDEHHLMDSNTTLRLFARLVGPAESGIVELKKTPLELNNIYLVREMSITEPDYPLSIVATCLGDPKLRWPHHLLSCTMQPRSLADSSNRNAAVGRGS